MAILAPMAGFTDDAFRKLCIDYGADLTITELISSERINRTDMEFREEEKFSIQLFGPTAESLASAYEKVKDKCYIVDFNFGCPSKNIISQGSGSAWLEKPKEMRKLFSMIKSPFTIKIRAGIKTPTYRKVIEVANQFSNIKWITFHARTAEQGYSGKANWEWIRDAVKISKIPIVGNGDVRTVEDHNELMSMGCVNTMIGRAARGNPFIFQEIKEGFSERKMMEALEKYIYYAKLYNVKFSYVKNNMMYFFRKHRNEITRIKNYDELNLFISSSGSGLRKMS